MKPSPDGIGWPHAPLPTPPPTQSFMPGEPQETTLREIRFVLEDTALEQASRRFPDIFRAPRTPSAARVVEVLLDETRARRLRNARFGFGTQWSLLREEEGDFLQRTRQVGGTVSRLRAPVDGPPRVDDTSSDRYWPRFAVPFLEEWRAGILRPLLVLHRLESPRYGAAADGVRVLTDLRAAATRRLDDLDRAAGDLEEVLPGRGVLTIDCPLGGPAPRFAPLLGFCERAGRRVRLFEEVARRLGLLRIPRPPDEWVTPLDQV